MCQLSAKVVAIHNRRRNNTSMMLRRVAIAHVLLHAQALLAPQPTPLKAAPVPTTRATHTHGAQIVMPVRRRRARLAAVPVQRSDDGDDDGRPPSLSLDPEVLLVVTCYFLQGASASRGWR